MGRNNIGNAPGAARVDGHGHGHGRRVFAAVLVALATAVASLAGPAQAVSTGFQLYLPVPVGAVVNAGGPHDESGSATGSGTRAAVDFGMPGSAEMGVFAAAGGTAHVQGLGGWSRCIVEITHSGGWSSQYVHLKNIPAGLDGTTVSAGQRIGDAGMPGSETCGIGSFRHVHFKLKLNGTPVAIDGTSIGGYTIHQTSTNYCGYWTRNSDGAIVADARSQCMAVPSLTNNQVLPGSGGGVAEGSLVSHNGFVYRIAGGAPIYVSNWAAVGGPQTATNLSDAQFNALRQYPADGTLVNTQLGYVYRFVGGAPLYISSWADIGGDKPSIRVDQAALETFAAEPWSHVRKTPADGSLVSVRAGGYVYRFAGGAPTYVSSWADIGGSQPSVEVSRSALDAGGEQARPWGGHVNKVPGDGTVVGSSPGGYVYRFIGGAPVYVQSSADIQNAPVTTVISRSNVDAAGDTAQPWAGHMNKYPSDGSLASANGNVFIFAGGAPIYVSNWANIGGARPSYTVSKGTLEQGGNTAVPYGHTLMYPKDGTVLSPPGRSVSFSVTSGVPSTISRVSGLVVDGSALDNAGGAWPWNHLKSGPPKATLGTVPATTSGSSFTVPWPKVESASATASYQARWKPYGSYWRNPASWAGLTGLSVVKTSLRVGKTYCFAVRAKNIRGVTGPWSPTKCTKRTS